jgi:type IV pilus assembly protein PilW
MVKQSGMTLVELMVALVLGIFIAAAALQLFLTGSINYKLQKAMAELQDNGNFGLNYIVRDIKLANLDANLSILNDRNSYSGVVFSSYHSYTSLTENDEKTQTANLPLNLKGNRSKTVYLTQGNGQTGWSGLSNVNEAKSDQLVIQYKAYEPGAMDCEGATVTREEIEKGTFIIQRYFLRNEGGELALACDAGRYQTLLETDSLPGDIQGFGDDGQVILRRVDHFHVLLGVKDSVADEFKYVTLKDYMGTANTLVKDGSSRARIMSVQFGILMRGVDSLTDGQDVPSKFIVLDQTVNLKDAAKKQKYIREVVTQTVALRNGYGLMEKL